MEEGKGKELLVPRGRKLSTLCPLRRGEWPFYPSLAMGIPMGCAAIGFDQCPRRGLWQGGPRRGEPKNPPPEAGAGRGDEKHQYLNRSPNASSFLIYSVYTFPAPVQIVPIASGLSPLLLSFLFSPCALVQSVPIQ